ncbi:hypothetical protein PHOSAC3_120539 [Mesotoga infera]|nr:hypothetical protein PHOSAC3_120539 [Mesotoga infera]
MLDSSINYANDPVQYKFFEINAKLCPAILLNTVDSSTEFGSQITCR